MTGPPDEAILIKAFVNTIDLSEDTDELSTPAAAGRWLVEHGLLDGHLRQTADEHRDLLDLRTGMRSALGVTDPALLAVGEAVLADLPVRVSLTGPALGPAPLPPARQALARLAVAWVALVLTGGTLRLKRCADDRCGWVFWDVSRNHSRRWCTMRVCGNREKARRYAARLRGAEPDR
ncbi:MAG TPA: CGNR zinc finger domain-containing protein [Micromonospora sp.]